MTISVIALDHKDFAQQVTKSIISAGVDAEVIDISHWQRNDNNLIEDAAVLALGQPSMELIEDLAGQLSKKTGKSILGAFHPKYNFWSNQLLSFLDDCFTCPCSYNELLFRLKKQAKRIDNASDNKGIVLPGMLGQSEKFINAANVIKKLAPVDATILLSGESGTGKELAARAVHYNSSRKKGPFIAINCGAIPRDLVENELFGHRRGAYTGAGNSSQGIIAKADKGTLFLDEISNIDMYTQGVLLRFLQSGEYSQLGGGGMKKADVRIVCATNVSLEKMIHEQRFRLDLYYRINVLQIELPSLRERHGDIELLAQYFLKKFQQHYPEMQHDFSFEYLEWLKNCQWPGNVRELENRVHRDYLMSDGYWITLDCEEAKTMDSDEIQSYQVAKERIILKFEKSYLEATMKKANGNVTKAAAFAKKDRSDFSKLLKKHDMQRKSFL